jgi:hypothetical protein
VIVAFGMQSLSHEVVRSANRETLLARYRHWRYSGCAASC